ncbi:MAG: GNAT family N-acetyltransferase [Proteobacteria bacterium]|nr:GNAT family N-acetyltransferase [Pseudomonadota bacterium]
MIVCESARLRLRHLIDADAPFILELLNEPDFIRNIGDRQVRTLEDARNYIQHGPVVSYGQHGFGLFLVELRDNGAPIGICGLLKREYLDDIDVGFALRESYRGKGYAFEAASAAMRHGQEDLGIRRIVAITSPDNHASAKVLRKLGLEFERTIRLPDQLRDTRLFTPATGAAGAT